MNSDEPSTDRVLEVRLDALLKNFQQIARTKSEVAARVKEVRDLHYIANIDQLGILNRLDDVGDDITTTCKRLNKLSERLPPGAMTRPIDNLEGAGDVVSALRLDLERMLQIIDRMADRWKQTVDERLKPLDATLLRESDLRVGTIKDFQRKLGSSTAERADIWDDYENLAYRDGETLFGEYVDFIGGLALRNTGIDHGVCQMADDLIGRLYLIGSTEIFHSMTLPTRRVESRKTIARIIRMGFPEWTVWAVPLGVHEFGHVVINANPELHELIATATAQERWTFLPPALDTYLADAFATGAMGPAYACATVLLRLDPCCLDRDARQQGELTCQAASPDSRRAYVILKTLELMAETTASYEGVRSMLLDDWRKTLGAFDLKFELGAEEPQLDACAEVMWGFLKERSSQVIYRPTRYEESAAWSVRSLAASASVGDGDEAHDGAAAPGGGPALPDLQQITVRDVLNMAWRERLEEPENATGKQADRIAEAALELWSTLFHMAPDRDDTWDQPVRGGLR
jgi:hypothetical protein